jgi:hypothetical protein
MTDYYPIVNVNPDWAVGQEAMGTKSKFWYRQPGQDESEWLFKHPRKNTGEHWAEKIAAEVAAVLKIPRPAWSWRNLSLDRTGCRRSVGRCLSRFWQIEGI